MNDFLGYELIEKIVKKNDFKYEEIDFSKESDERNGLLLATFLTYYGEKYLRFPSTEAILMDCYLVDGKKMLFARPIIRRYTRNIDGFIYEFIGATVDSKDKVHIIYKRRNKYVIEIMPLIRCGYKVEQFPLCYYFEKQTAYDFIAMICDENS